MVSQADGISAQQALLGNTFEGSEQPSQFQDNPLLWQYMKLGTVDGVPVKQQDKGLLFASDQQLVQAMQHDQQVNTWSGWLSPDREQDLKIYNDIKQGQISGDIRIINQDKQFSPQKNAFLVVVTYSKLHLKLNPRYDFYKQDTK